MNVTMRSDDGPDVRIEAAECCNLQKLDQHIRTLQAARRWLVREKKIKRQRDAAAAEAAKKAARQHAKAGTP